MHKCRSAKCKPMQTNLMQYSGHMVITNQTREHCSKWNAIQSSAGALKWLSCSLNSTLKLGSFEWFNSFLIVSDNSVRINIQAVKECTYDYSMNWWRIGTNDLEKNERKAGKCNECENAFSHKSDMRMHMMTHLYVHRDQDALWPHLETDRAHAIAQMVQPLLVH